MYYNIYIYTYLYLINGFWLGILKDPGNIINLKSPKGDSTISVSKDMEEYYLKMGYTKVTDTVKKPMFSNKAKFFKKENKNNKRY